MAPTSFDHDVAAESFHDSNGHEAMQGSMTEASAPSQEPFSLKEDG